jgi:hypothetical protein
MDKICVWVCEECGQTYGKRNDRRGYISTWHYGKCYICKDNKPVTESRDFSLYVDKKPSKRRKK